MSPHTVLPRQTRLGSPRSSLSSADLGLEHTEYQYFLFCSAGTELYPTIDMVPWKLSSALRTAFTKGILKNLPTFSESLNWNLHSCKKIRLVPRAGFPKVRAPPRSTHTPAVHLQQERTQVVGTAHDALPFLNLHTLARVLSYPILGSHFSPREPITFRGWADGRKLKSGTQAWNHRSHLEAGPETCRGQLDLSTESGWGWQFAG